MVKIRKLKKEDLRKVLKIITQTRAATKKAEANWILTRSLEKGKIPIKSEYYILTINNKIVGVSGLYNDFEDSNNVKWLDYLAVDPKKQGRGYGTMMLNNLEKICKKRKIKMLFVFTDNPRAIKFYEKNKFKMFGKIDNYFPNNLSKNWLCKKL